MSDKNNLVKEVCKELDITQKELANRLGTHLTTVQKWAASDELPSMAQKAIELLIENKKHKEIVDTYKKLQQLLHESEQE